LAQKYTFSPITRIYTQKSEAKCWKADVVAKTEAMNRLIYLTRI